MIINKINITAFGGIKDKSFIFSEGTNVIYGLNEAGKSTICAFVCAMLYGMNKPLKTDNRVDLRQRYIPWDTQVASGSLEFTYNDEEYIVERKFGKTKRSDRCVLRYLKNWKECTSINVESLGMELLGLSEESFVKTVFMGQLETKIYGKDDEILKKLSNLSTTGDEEVSFGKINKILSEAKLSIIPKASAKTIMTELNSKKQALEAEIAEIVFANESLRDSVIENNSISIKIKEKKKELALLTKEREQARNYEKYQADEKIKETLNSLSNRNANSAEKLKELLTKLNDKNAEIKCLDEEKLSDSISKATSLCEKIKVAEAYKINAEAKKEEILHLKREQTRLRKRSSNLISILFLCSAFLLFGLSFISLYFVALNTYIFHSLLTIGVILLIISIVGFVKSTSAKKKEANINSDIRQKEEKLLSILSDADVNKIQAELDDVLLSLNAQSLDELKKKQENLVALKGEIELLTKEIEMLEKIISQTESDIESNKKMLKGTEECEQTRAFEEIDKEFTILNDELLRLETRKNELDFKISHSSEGLRTLDVAKTELSQTETEIAHYTSVHKSLEIAINAMAECEEELKSGFTPELHLCVNEILSSLSEEKYADIKLSDDYSALVREPQGNTIVDAKKLSGGTYDLIYIAVRLGILKAIFGKKIPLVIMDDTFLQLDDERQKSAINYLNETNIIVQMFYFTCHSDIVEKYKKSQNVNLINI